MRSALVRLAQNVSAVPIPEMKAAVQSLLPPLQLYKRLLRAHRKHLPVEMKVLGMLMISACFVMQHADLRLLLR